MLLDTMLFPAPPFPEATESRRGIEIELGFVRYNTMPVIGLCRSGSPPYLLQLEKIQQQEDRTGPYKIQSSTSLALGLPEAGRS